MFVKKTIIVTSIALMAGCATSPWEGVPYQQANEWRGIGVSPVTARAFIVNGYTPVDAKPWIQYGIQSPQEVMSWHRAGFSPAESKKWIDKGFTVQQAKDYKAKGLTVGG